MSTPSLSLRISIFITAATPAEAPLQGTGKRGGGGGDVGCLDDGKSVQRAETFRKKHVVGAGWMPVPGRNELGDVPA
jgi:hypothetical protein